MNWACIYGLEKVFKGLNVFQLKLIEISKFLKYFSEMKRKSFKKLTIILKNKCFGMTNLVDRAPTYIIELYNQ